MSRNAPGSDLDAFRADQDTAADHEDDSPLPDEMAISAVTLAELSAGPHQIRPNGEQDLYDEHEERARRTEALQRAENEFDPVPFDVEAARVYGR